MSGPRFTNIIEDFPSTVPLVRPEAQERARCASFRARIGAYESVYGPSPEVIETVQVATRENWKYCDPYNFDLKNAIADFHSVKPENIVIIEGIDGGLGLANRMLVEPR